MAQHIVVTAYNVGNYVSTNNSGTSSKHILYVGSYDKSTWTWNTRVISTGTSVWNVGGQYVDVRGFDMTSSNPSATWGIHGQGAYSRYIDNYIHDIYSDSPGFKARTFTLRILPRRRSSTPGAS